MLNGIKGYLDQWRLMVFLTEAVASRDGVLPNFGVDLWCQLLRFHMLNQMIINVLVCCNVIHLIGAFPCAITTSIESGCFYRGLY